MGLLLVPFHRSEEDTLLIKQAKQALLFDDSMIDLSNKSINKTSFPLISNT